MFDRSLEKLNQKSARGAIHVINLGITPAGSRGGELTGDGRAFALENVTVASSMV